MTVPPDAREALDRETRALVLLGVALGRRDPVAIRQAVRECAASVRPRAVEEALLQAYLFVGFPTALAAASAWKAVRPSTPPEEGPAKDEGRSEWKRRGEALCARIYGRGYEKLRRNVRDLHPALDRWMIEEGYGKVLSRPGLDPASRELCIVASLAVHAAEPQLHSHLRGALNAGASPGAVDAVLELVLDRLDPADPRRRWVGELWHRVREAARQR